MIPPLDLKAQYLSIEDEIDAAIKSVVTSGQFVLGPYVRAFEEQMAEYLGCKHVVGVASGTDALLLSLLALDVGPGDEVITSPLTFTATASTIVRAGARPVFVDVDPSTYNIDVGRMKAALSEKTKAIIPVHLFGLCADMGGVCSLAEEHRLLVIEDAAQAVGATWNDKMAGTIGDVGCFSFYPTKNLGAYGDGGVVSTNSSETAEMLDVLRRQGCRKKYFADRVGFNSRLDALQAAILAVKLRHLPEWTKARFDVVSRYGELLRETPLGLPSVPKEAHHVFHQYTVRAPRRDDLVAYLKDRGIVTMVYYPSALHLQPAFREFGRGEGSCPEAERACHEVLSLPLYPELAIDAQQEIAEAISGFYES